MTKRNVKHSSSPYFTQPPFPLRVMSEVGHTFMGFLDVWDRGRAHSTCSQGDVADSAVQPRLSDNASGGDSEIIWENAN